MILAAKDGPCTDCGVRYPPYVMQFDHVRGVKRLNVSAMASCTYGPAPILAEIAKCDLVCANCHAERTYARKEGPHRENRSSEMVARAADEAEGW
jgi:hypothetical protein